MKQNAIGYIRLSQKEKNSEEPIETTFARQSKLIERYAKKNGYELIEVLQDPYQSGGKLETPTFQELIDKANGVDINVVIVKDLSRFARNLKRQEDTYNLFKRKGVKLKAVLDIDPEEKFQRRLMGVINEQYLDKMRKDTANLHLTKLKEGLPIGRPPFGYRRSPATKQWLVDIKKAKIIRYIYQEYGIKKRTVKDLVGELNMTETKIRKLLRDKTYTGKLIYTKRYRDDDNRVYKQEKQEYPGKHEAIISIEQYEAVKKLREYNQRNGEKWRCTTQ